MQSDGKQQWWLSTDCGDSVAQATAADQAGDWGRRYPDDAHHKLDDQSVHQAHDAGEQKTWYWGRYPDAVATSPADTAYVAPPRHEHDQHSQHQAPAAVHEHSFPGQWRSKQLWRQLALADQQPVRDDHDFRPT